MDITSYASLSKGGTDWTDAFSAAVADLRARGGGELNVPAGDYPTGAIRLYSHMTLRVENGARVRFVSRADAYPLIPLEFEGIGGLSHHPCVFAEDAEYVRLTGGGILDGQGEYWWEQVRAKTLVNPRPYLVCFSRCRNVVVEDLTLTRSPVWTVHPLRCQNVVIRGITIVNPADSPNTDGIDPNACEDVRIFDNTIDVGDDCIAIKSGTEDTPGRSSCRRIIIANCHFLHGHGGVVLGSEMSGGIRDVVVSDCVFHQTDRGVRLKTRRGRGGAVEGLQLKNLLMNEVMCPFVFNMHYFCGKDGKQKRVWDKAPYPVDDTTPALRDVSISGVTARGCTACAGFFYGLSEMPIARVTLFDVMVEMAKDASAGKPAMMDGCPEMSGAGFYLRNATGVRFQNVRASGVKGKLLDLDDTVAMEDQA